mmetsp:Transcript_69121/g.137101  ORF Transcript_69121/g.137101 Transcript_69121/m.137101 type:complete len:211 (+) Transcript_69121:74-706(+)
MPSTEAPSPHRHRVQRHAHQSSTHALRVHRNERKAERAEMPSWFLRKNSDAQPTATMPRVTHVAAGCTAAAATSSPGAISTILSSSPCSCPSLRRASRSSSASSPAVCMRARRSRTSSFLALRRASSAPWKSATHTSSVSPAQFPSSAEPQPSKKEAVSASGYRWRVSSAWTEARTASQQPVVRRNWRPRTLVTFVLVVRHCFASRKAAL